VTEADHDPTQQQVMLDDFGYDFGVSRARQNSAVDYAHAQWLAVIANAL
jgi:hypothetical protein